MLGPNFWSLEKRKPLLEQGLENFAEELSPAKYAFPMTTSSARPSIGSATGARWRNKGELMPLSSQYLRVFWLSGALLRLLQQEKP